MCWEGYLGVETDIKVLERILWCWNEYQGVGTDI